jgi:tetratricopeptide (TPR) repeat protein
MNIFCKLNLHSWAKNDCSFCIKCGVIIETNHLWIKSKCKKCGKTADDYNISGQTKCGQNKYEEGIKDFTKAIELDPLNSFAYNNRGYTKYLLKDYRGAIEDCEKAIEINPLNDSAYNNCGIAKKLF